MNRANSSNWDHAPTGGRWLPTGRAVFIAFATCLCLIGCASKPKPESPPTPTSIKGAIVASSNVNPDRNGRASPVVMKLFELRSLAQFQVADFFSLFEKEKEALGAELVAREEYTLMPGARTELVRQVHPETRHVGVIVAFRDLERSSWRASLPVSVNQVTPFVVLLEGTKVLMVVP